MSEIYQRELDDVVEEFETSIDDGLSESQVEKSREEYGENKLDETETKSKWEILLENLNNIIVYLLGIAAVISVIMGDWVEAVAILLAVLISVLTGYFVELGAQKSVEALQSMVDTKAKVLRDGKEIEIDSTELVPGDVLILGEGDAIAADGRLISDNNFAVMEAALTGESEAVDKDADASFDEEEAVGDQLNMVFSGTAVTRGKARAIITGTGMDTEVGRISEMLGEEQDNETPLDKEIDQLGKALIIVAFVAAALVLLIGILNGQDTAEMLHVAVILAVAAIPEAMPAVQTITLSNGMTTMAEHEALVKTLSAVETLGSTSIIASDKTGTLTENQMMVERLIIKRDEVYEVTGSGYEPKGAIKYSGEVVDIEAGNIDDVEDLNDNDQVLIKLITDGFLSSDAVLTKVSEEDDDDNDEDIKEEDKGEYKIKGDPTDGALTVLGHKIGLSPEFLKENNYEQLAEITFDSDKKYMATFHKFPNDIYRFIMKGALDVVAEYTDIDDDEVEFWTEKNKQLTEEGNRVIGLASYTVKDEGEAQEITEDIEGWFENNHKILTIDGLFGIMDPPRQDVAESIRQTQEAGIRVKMITGDHPRTASVIAKEIGINNWENTMTGKEIDKTHDSNDFIDRIQDTAVFARVSPENKLQIVRALQDEGEVVAMTGDGVNDAPALNGADIGVAMGIRGTEVAKEASDMILTDDRYSTIVDAVREGRIIFENIKKYVSFLFACNMVEIVSILFTIVFLLPMPIQPLHILFLNLLIDIGPAIALAYEEAEDDVMSHPPRNPENGLVNRKFLSQIITSGIFIGLGAFGIFFAFYNFSDFSLEYAQTVTFSYMAIAQLMHIFNVRKFKSFGLDKSFFKNKLLVGAMALGVVLQLIAVYTPFMNNVLGTEPLTLMSWGIIFGAAAVATFIVHWFKVLTGQKGAQE
ncbi:HAD-IC family P-type ATPase [Aerococcaceae bacterium DSM 111021]|nr:HAD-IC family P-type ATPase [Aerococcaceae bacterium DSM 111021]